MLPYNKNLKSNAQRLRSNMTHCERKLWAHLRKKKLSGIQFYRQKTIGNYIVDFYAPKAKLVVEVDGGQHFQEDHKSKDRQRDEYLSNLGMRILRFNNTEVLQEFDGVLKSILNQVEQVEIL